MKQIYIFTDDYRDILEQKLPKAVPHNFNGLDCFVAEDGSSAAVVLAEIAKQTVGIGTSKELEDKFRDFLEENEYINLDAFMRICLEDFYA
jgi:hypothetical protein